MKTRHLFLTAASLALSTSLATAGEDSSAYEHAKSGNGKGVATDAARGKTPTDSAAPIVLDSDQLEIGELPRFPRSMWDDFRLWTHLNLGAEGRRPDRPSLMSAANPAPR